MSKSIFNSSVFTISDEIIFSRRDFNGKALAVLMEVANAVGVVVVAAVAGVALVEDFAQVGVALFVF